MAKHWLLSNEGQWPLRGRKRRTEVLWLPELTDFRVSKVNTRRVSLCRAYWTLWNKKTDLKVQGTKAARVFRIELTEQELWRSVKQSSRVLSWVLISMYMWEKLLEIKESNRISGNSAWCSHRAKNSACSYSQTKNFRMHGQLCRIQCLGS